TELWRSLAIKEGLKGFHFVGLGIFPNEVEGLGLDACTPHTPHSLVSQIPITFKDKITYRLFGKAFKDLLSRAAIKPRIHSYSEILEIQLKQKYAENEYPVALPNW